MIKICILTFALIQFYFSPHSAAKHAEDDKVKSEAKRAVLHSLLKEPVDEEHDELGESDATHAHEWTIQIHKGNEQAAKDLADSYGFKVVSKVEVGDGVFRFLNPRDQNEENKNENKRDDDNSYIKKRELLLQELGKRLGSDKRILWYKRERILTREKRVPVDFKVHAIPNRHVSLSDPQFVNQWYIRNDGQTTGPPKFDSNVVAAWNMGFTGKGVAVSILDDGMDHTHPDLIGNYDQEASKDLNGHDNDPFPNDSDPYNAHGTKCSGTVAATGNNSLCGIGIAFNANIGAIRMLDGKATDGLEANALSFHRDHIDIYSCSWGPKDNGRTFGRPGSLGRIALAQGAKYGRKGLGSLFVWATGNGGVQKDDCNADGYVNSIYTMGIGSVNEHGVSTYYGEKCSAMFAVTYCSGGHSLFSGNSRANVITTYLHHQCTKHFVGTSSAAPLAAGIIALVLEANPKLTWRDMQHILFHTAKVTSPLDAGWQKNGCGKHVNHKFGFGLLDAFLMVNLALNWTRVPEQKRCHFRLNFKNGDIPSKRHFKLNFTTDACQSCTHKKKINGICKNAVKKLEHVVVNVTLKHRRRGDLSISLISPHGTISHLLRRRPYDNSDSGLKGWKFMTVFNWCENPSGTWQLVFQDNTSGDLDDNKRDFEVDYIKYLDKQKRKMMNDIKRSKKQQQDEENEEDKTLGSNKNIFDTTEARSDAESFSVDAQVENQKRNINRGSEADKSKNTVAEAKDTAGKPAGYRDTANTNDPYYRQGNYRREDETIGEDEDLYYSGSYRRRDYDVDRDLYSHRTRREAVKKMDMDEEHVREMQKEWSKQDITYKDPVLKRSALAGEVQAISVTFYGTA